MYINNYFNTTIWSEQKPEFVKSLNKASNKYIADARKNRKDYIKQYGDFGIEPFRFIHWNIQAVPKGMAKDV